jgi:hypothetical protein
MATVSGVGVMIFFALNVVWPQQIAILYNTSPETTGWVSVSGDMKCSILRQVLTRAT